VQLHRVDVAAHPLRRQLRVARLDGVIDAPVFFEFPGRESLQLFIEPRPPGSMRLLRKDLRSTESTSFRAVSDNNT